MLQGDKSLREEEEEDKKDLLTEEERAQEAEGVRRTTMG